MSRKKKTKFHFTLEQLAVWRGSSHLTVCPKYRRAGVDKLVAHIKADNCE
jgi:hypothetical protein